MQGSWSRSLLFPKIIDSWKTESPNQMTKLDAPNPQNRELFNLEWLDCERKPIKPPLINTSGGYLSKISDNCYIYFFCFEIIIVIQSKNIARIEDPIKKT